MNPADNINNLFKNSKITVAPELDQKILNKAAAALPRQAASPARSTWSIVMQSRITKPLAAAILVVAALTGIYQLTGSIDGAAKVYAAAIKALDNVKTVHISGWTSHLYPRHTFAGETFSNLERYPMEIWCWYTESNEYREYNRQGPLLVWNNGERTYEYHSDKERLFVSKSSAYGSSLPRDFYQVKESLSQLKERGVEIESIGNRTIGATLAAGYSFAKNDKRTEIWIDPQNNRVIENNRYRLKGGQWLQFVHRTISYDQTVPAEILSYTPPKTDNIYYDSNIDPRFEKWHLHLIEVAAYYQQNPLPATMELLHREDVVTMDTYAPGRLPGITAEKGLWVLPVQSSLHDFLLFHHRPSGTLRIPDELKDIQLNCDLITSNEFTPNQRIQFVLNALGYDLIETVQERTVWIAHYDGRPFKPWKEVKAPIPNPENAPFRPGMATGTGWPMSASALFNTFNYYQNTDLSGTGIVIVDETGLPYYDENAPEEYAICGETVYWGGQEAPAIARKWFQEEFGITFEEQQRRVPLWVVRKKDQETTISMAKSALH